MFDRRKVLGRGVRGGDAPFPEEEAARGNRAASYMQILSLATMHLLHLLQYFALHSTAILHCTSNLQILSFWAICCVLCNIILCIFCVNPSTLSLHLFSVHATCNSMSTLHFFGRT